MFMTVMVASETIFIYLLGSELREQIELLYDLSFVDRYRVSFSRSQQTGCSKFSWNNGSQVGDTLEERGYHLDIKTFTYHSCTEYGMASCSYDPFVDVVQHLLSTTAREVQVALISTSFF